jgi:muramidase (phage lysozyme)
MLSRFKIDRFFVYMMPMLSCVQAGDDLLRHLQEPRVRALLDTIAYAEGTLHANGYRVLFGGTTFYSFDEHPQKKTCVIRKGKKICTTAAGRYQIQYPTWDHFMNRCGINKKHGDTSFSPLNQDRVAVYIIQKHGILSLLDVYPIAFEEIFGRLGRTWSSMPGTRLGGESGPYTVYTAKQLRVIFERQLKKYV